MSNCTFFSQSTTSAVSFGDTIVCGFNDSGSTSFGAHVTGWSRSTDNGITWTDGGQLPAGSIGDAGDPVLARDNTTGRIYFATLGLNSPQTIQVFRSDDGGAATRARRSLWLALHHRHDARPSGRANAPAQFARKTPCLRAGRRRHVLGQASRKRTSCSSPRSV